MFYELINGKYKHIFWGILVVFILFFFKIAFFNYIPTHNGKLDQSSHYNVNEKRGVLWNSSLFSRIPWCLNDPAFNDPVSNIIRKVTDIIMDWRIIYLILVGFGRIYIFQFF